MTDRRFRFVLVGLAANGLVPQRLEAVLAERRDLQARSDHRHVMALGTAIAALSDLDAETTPVAVGGDGTLSLMVQALHTLGRLDRPIGVLPFGTGNAFAYSQGLLPAARAVNALHSSSVRELDLMLTSHPDAPVAVTSLSTGVEARFIHGFARLRRWTRPVGVALAFGGALGAGRTRVSLQLDGETVLASGDWCIGAGLYNTRVYAFGHEVFPEADPADGLAEGVVFTTRRAYVRGLIRGISSGASRSGLIFRRWREARIETTGLLQIDGEIVGPSALNVTVARGALQILVPSFVSG